MLHTPKVLVIGIDALCWEVIDKPLKDGKLPNLKKLINSGSYGVLKSVVPPNTIPAWPCIITGKSPGKLNLYDYFFIDGKNRTSVVSSDVIKNKTLFDIFSDYGKKVVVFNVPCTYPPWEVNGVLVSGFMAPDNNTIHSNYNFSEEVRNKYITALGVKDIKRSTFKNLEDMEIYRTKLFIDTVLEQNAEFAMIVYRSTDPVQHLFFNDKAKLEEYFSIIDCLIGNLISKFSQSNIIIISDHGMTGIKKLFQINNWLEQEGYLKYKSYSRIISEESIVKFFSKLHLIKLVQKVAQFIDLRVIQMLARKIHKTGKEVDYEKSAAYYLGSYFININKNRDYNSIITEIKTKLMKLKDGDENIIEAVYYKEELYNTNKDDAPDIIFVPKGYNYMPVNTTYTQEILCPPYFKESSSSHSSEGLIVTTGPDMLNNKKIFASILDLVPSCLKLMGVPVPSDIDGTQISVINQKDTNKKSILDLDKAISNIKLK